MRGEGGHAWQGGHVWGMGTCMARGECVVEGVRGKRGGMHGREFGGGACVQERRPLKRAVRILLECILVITNSACHSPAFRSELFSDLYG